jgi:hypothetical protein
MTGRVMNSEFRIMNKRIQLNTTFRAQYEVPFVKSLLRRSWGLGVRELIFTYETSMLKTLLTHRSMIMDVPSDR